MTTANKKEGGKQKWIKFVEIPHTSKLTKLWEVQNIDNGSKIGRVGWYGAWRGYAFSPYSQTIFEKTCLRDIAEFIEQENIKHREKRAAEKTR